MQAIVCVMSIIDSAGTMYSRSGGSPSGISHGVTRRIFFQWTASMSTIRSLITGMLPIGSTWIVPSSERSAALSRCVWQASIGRPLMRTPHEPQIAARQEQRMPIEPSSRSLAWRIPSSTERVPSRSILNSSQYGASPDSGRYRRSFSVYSGISGSSGMPVRARSEGRRMPGEDAGRVQWRSPCPDRGRGQAPAAPVRVRGGMPEGPLVSPLLGLPLGHGYRSVVDLRRVPSVDRDGDVLEPLVVVALGEVEAELRAAGLPALERAHDDGLGAVEHVAQLDRAQDVLVEDGAAVVDVGRRRLLLETADRLVGRGEALLVAEHRALFVHHRAELVLDLGDPAAAALAAQDVLDHAALVGQLALRGRRHRHARAPLGGGLARAAAEDEGVEQRVGPEAVAAVDGDAGDLARGVEAGDRGLAPHVGLDAAHDVVAARLDVDGLAGDVDPGEVAADVDDLAQRLERALAGDLGDVERHGAVGEAAALVDLRLLRARDDVARGKLELVGRILLHEALALGVVEVRALAAGALRDEDPVARQRGRVVLDHLHVHQRRAEAEGLRHAVARADERVRGWLEALAGATGGEDRRLGAEQLHRAVLDVARHSADALALVVLGERGDEPLLVAVDLLVVLHQLLVEHVQQGLARDVGHVVGTGGGGAAEGPGAELALGVAVEGHALVLELEHLARRLAAHDLDGVLIAEVVGALDGVERVRLPGVVRVERGVDAAGRRVGVRADGVDLAQDGDGRPLARGREGGALAGEPRPDDEDVVCGHGRDSSQRILRAASASAAAGATIRRVEGSSAGDPRLALAGAELLALIRDWPAWTHRRVEHVTFLEEDLVRRRISVDLSVPGRAPQGWGGMGAEGSRLLPLGLLRKGRLA